MKTFLSMLGLLLALNAYAAAPKSTSRKVASADQCGAAAKTIAQSYYQKSYSSFPNTNPETNMAQVGAFELQSGAIFTYGFSGTYVNTSVGDNGKPTRFGYFVNITLNGDCNVMNVNAYEEKLY